MVAVGALSYSTSANAQTKVAPVIGNSVYRSVPEIPNPPNDAADIAAAFLRLKFSVRLITGTNYDTMRHELKPVLSDAIKAVRRIGKRVCPLACPVGSHAENELRVTNAPPPAKRERACIAREAPPRSPPEKYLAGRAATD